MNEQPTNRNVPYWSAFTSSPFLWQFCKYGLAVEAICKMASRPRLFDCGDEREAAIGAMRNIDHERAVECLAGLLESRKYFDLAPDSPARLLRENDASKRIELAHEMDREASLVAYQNLEDKVRRLLSERRKQNSRGRPP